MRCVYGFFWHSDLRGVSGLFHSLPSLSSRLCALLLRKTYTPRPRILDPPRRRECSPPRENTEEGKDSSLRSSFTGEERGRTKSTKTTRFNEKNFKIVFSRFSGLLHVCSTSLCLLRAAAVSVFRSTYPGSLERRRPTDQDETASGRLLRTISSPTSRLSLAATSMLPSTCCCSLLRPPSIPGLHSEILRTPMGYFNFGA